jgi:PST family polysaccharide transporter
MLLNSSVGWIHLSIGRPNRWLYWTIFEFVVTALLFVVGLHWGPQGVAICWSISSWILFVPAFWYAGRPIGFGVTSLVGPVSKCAAASLLAGLATAGIVRGFALQSTSATAGPMLERIIVVSAVFLTLYLGAVTVLHRGCAPLRQLVSLLREFAPASRSSAFQAVAKES